MEKRRNGKGYNNRYIKYKIGFERRSINLAVKICEHAFKLRKAEILDTTAIHFQTRDFQVTSSKCIEGDKLTSVGAEFFTFNLADAIGRNFVRNSVKIARAVSSE